jgi:DNA polymerase-1
MTDEQLHYAAQDAWIERQVYLAQRSQITKKSFNIWCQVDRPALWAVLDFQGFHIDADAWKALAEHNQSKSDELSATLSFNPRSPKQVMAILSSCGFSGMKKTDEEELSTFIKKKPNTDAAKLAQTILDIRMYGKRASTYGFKMIEHHLEQDDGIDVVHPNWIITGAETGRQACTDPNLQNIPARETKDYRRCFIARPGNKIIVADYSAQEPRITAHVTQDERLIEIFKSEQDVYIVMALLILGKKVSKKSKERTQMKPVFLGATYGLSKYGLAKRLEIPVDDADELIIKFFKEFPGVGLWVHHQTQTRNHVETVMGRRCWLNPYSYQSERNALNAPIQGTASDMTKLAFSTLHREWDFDCPFGVVAPIHDELVLDVPEHLAQDITIRVKETMERVGNQMCPSVPFVADVTIGNSWADKE